jgi:hypothetical protein
MLDLYSLTQWFACKIPAVPAGCDKLSYSQGLKTFGWAVAEVELEGKPRSKLKAKSKSNTIITIQHGILKDTYNCKGY